MEHDTERRIREFVLIANAVMNQIPRPVPVSPMVGASSLQDLSEWEGEVLEVSALHRAYNRLPAVVQTQVATGYGQCLKVLEHQDRNALNALSARYIVFAEVLSGTGLSPEQLVPDIHADAPFESEPTHWSQGRSRAPVPDDPDGDDTAPVIGPRLRLVPPDDDDLSGAIVGREASRWWRRKVWSVVGAASLIAVGCFGSLAWQRITASPAVVQTLLIDVSTENGATGAMSTVLRVEQTHDEPVVGCLRVNDGNLAKTLAGDAPDERITATHTVTKDARDATTENSESGSSTQTTVIRIRPGHTTSQSMDAGARDASHAGTGRWW